MDRTGMITMSMRELDRLKLVQAIVETGLKPGRAAERLGVRDARSFLPENR